ncbi:hypothetical protein BRD17_09080 [Halobacteriales archaeon SW_7_68_16]|nr:MAG: hypothetical protein BRD17_09080 [Halobacteriales archaeon SW_7_68_16]
MFGTSAGTRTSAAGVKGRMTNADSDGAGVYGDTDSTVDRSAGVRGESSASGKTVGVYGVSYSDEVRSAGVRGDAQNDTAYGVYGKAQSEFALGVVAENSLGGNALRSKGPARFDNRVTFKGHITIDTLGASVYHSTTQSISNTTSTLVKFDSENFDDSSEFTNSSTPHTFSPDNFGRYQVESTVQWIAPPSGADLYIEILKNGTTVARTRRVAGSGSNESTSVSKVLELSSSDSVTIEVYQDSGGDLGLNSGEANTYATFSRMG